MLSLLLGFFDAELGHLVSAGLGNTDMGIVWALTGLANSTGGIVMVCASHPIWLCSMSAATIPCRWEDHCRSADTTNTCIGAARYGVRSRSGTSDVPLRAVSVSMAHTPAVACKRETYAPTRFGSARRLAVAMRATSIGSGVS
jgi:hypothetical protein